MRPACRNMLAVHDVCYISCRRLRKWRALARAGRDNWAGRWTARSTMASHRTPVSARSPVFVTIVSISLGQCTYVLLAYTSYERRAADWAHHREMAFLTSYNLSTRRRLAALRRWRLADAVYGPLPMAETSSYASNSYLNARADASAQALCGFASRTTLAQSSACVRTKAGARQSGSLTWSIASTRTCVRAKA